MAVRGHSVLSHFGPIFATYLIMRRKRGTFILCFSLLLLLVLGWTRSTLSLANDPRSKSADRSLSSLGVSDHPGYLTTIEGERNLRIFEIAPVPQLPPPEKPLSEKIFTTELTNEFKERYRYEFGQTEAERISFFPNPYSYYEATGGEFSGTALEDSEKKRDFGVYMFRRLAEFHFDHYAKNEPAVRPVWELKERIRQVKVEVSPGYTLAANYSFSGNYLESSLVNPYLTTKVVLLMDPKTTGPGPVMERWVSVQKQISPTVSIESHYKDTLDRYWLITRKKLRPDLEGNITLSTGKVGEETQSLTPTYEISTEDISLVRDHQIMLGLTWW